jgi:hypothetical protein
MTDFRALCFDLVEELEVWIGYGDEADCADAHVVVDRARAALAEQPVAPMDKLDRLIALDRDDPANALPLPAND